MSSTSESAEPTIALAFTGDLADLPAEARRRLLDRAPTADSEISRVTAAIIERVRQRGDAELRDLARQYDGVELEALAVPRPALRAALDSLDPALRRAMDRTVANLSHVDTAFRPQAVEASPEPGIVIGRRPDPLERVGIYAPGGRATYPSSVLMAAIPARVAGVRDVVLCSPPSATGTPPDVVLAAATLAGVDRVFSIGGAGAIAAMAFGTESVRRVDKIVGPGNAYVAEAKRQLSHAMAIDAPAGPSELLVLVDDTSNADLVAGEMLAQAEHDPLACVVAVCVGRDIADAIVQQLVAQIGGMARADIVVRSLAQQGAVLAVADLDEAVRFANAYAPEHLLLAIDRAEWILTRVRNAGTVFVGESASVAFGDYMSGGNHVLPTGGSARAYSGLSVNDFVRWTTYQRIDRSAAARLAGDVAAFAASESLDGHTRAAARWRAAE